MSALVATVIISYNLICFHYNFVIFIQVHFLVVVLIINELLSFSLFLTILHRQVATDVDSIKYKNVAIIYAENSNT